MESHSFHPLHALVAIVLVVIGVMTATFGINWLAENRVVSGSVAIALVGLTVLPWPQRPRRPRTDTDESQAD